MMRRTFRYFMLAVSFQAVGLLVLVLFELMNLTGCAKTWTRILEVVYGPGIRVFGMIVGDVGVGNVLYGFLILTLTALIYSCVIALALALVHQGVQSACPCCF